MALLWPYGLLLVFAALMVVGGSWQWWEAVGGGGRQLAVVGGSGLDWLTVDGVVMVVGVEVRERVNMSDLG
jgi:hypothetical protein